MCVCVCAFVSLIICDIRLCCGMLVVSVCIGAHVCVYICVCVCVTAGVCVDCCICISTIATCGQNGIFHTPCNEGFWEAKNY